MGNDNVDITPSTKVAEMLDAFPELEDELIGIAAPFKKLKNPFLRKTVANVATLKHIAAVGNVDLNFLINKLRKTVGQPPSDQAYELVSYFTEQPDWFSPGKVVASLNDDTIEDKDKMTLTHILKAAKTVDKGNIIELTTTFLPAPGIDKLKGAGYSVWVNKEDNGEYKTYVLQTKG